MKYLPLIIYLILLWGSAYTHDMDIYRSCKNKGVDDHAMWSGTIKCEVVEDE